MDKPTHINLSQAYQFFNTLRTRGYSTSCVWFGDDRQYGEAWIGCEGARAYSVKWTKNDENGEALALLRAAILAILGEAIANEA